jgi:DNA polymerase sigma
MEEVFYMVDLVRLKQYEIDAIVNLFKEYFHQNDHLWIFGSRTNLTARGGDIDLYIETEISQADVVLSKKNKFVLALYEQIGEQKIDIIINMLASKVKLPIHEVARQTGVLLV